MEQDFQIFGLIALYIVYPIISVIDNMIVHPIKFFSVIIKLFFIATILNSDIYNLTSSQIYNINIILLNCILINIFDIFSLYIDGKKVFPKRIVSMFIEVCMFANNLDYFNYMFYLYFFVTYLSDIFLILFGSIFRNKHIPTIVYGFIRPYFYLMLYGISFKFYINGSDIIDYYFYHNIYEPNYIFVIKIFFQLAVIYLWSLFKTSDTFVYAIAICCGILMCIIIHPTASFLSICTLSIFDAINRIKLII